MTPRIKPQDDEAARIQLALDRRRQSWALVVTSASTMLAGIVIGYAFGTAHSLQRELMKDANGD
jgi:hypothetical protein